MTQIAFYRMIKIVFYKDINSFYKMTQIVFYKDINSFYRMI